MDKAGVDPLSTQAIKKYRKMIKESIDRMTDAFYMMQEYQIRGARWGLKNPIYGEGNFIAQSLEHSKLIKE